MWTDVVPGTGSAGAGGVPRRRSPYARWEDPPGPPPRLALIVAGAYALCGAALSGLGVVEAALGHGWRPLEFYLPIALYCGGLAWGATRVRSRTPARPAAPWLFAPLLAHALAGLSGAFALVQQGLRLPGGPAVEVGLISAFVGVLFGWAPALAPLCFARRGRLLFLAALSGVALPVVLIWVGGLPAR